MKIPLFDMTRAVGDSRPGSEGSCRRMAGHASAMGAFLLVLASIGPADSAEISVRMAFLNVPNGGVAGVELIAGSGGRRLVVVTDRKGTRYRLAAGKSGTFTLEPGAPSAAPPGRRSGMLPDGGISFGSRGISSAWLIEPTRRYGHGILGDAIEAGGVRAIGADGRTIQLTLGSESVFEDRLARLADMDGDGSDEIIVVRSYLKAGAALAVIKAERDRLRIIGEAKPIGRPSRWLNPAGFGDFDGDGQTEAAAVITPHIGGTLKLYALKNGGLEEKYAVFGFSNHAIGSSELGMAAVIDANGDGVVDLALPNARRRALRIVTFAGGRFKNLATVALGSEVTTAVISHNIDGAGRPEIILGLANGKVAVITPGV